MLQVGGSKTWKEKGKEEEEIGSEWEIRWRGKRGRRRDERREKRERAGLWGDGALSDAGWDHLDKSGARSLTVNTGHHFHMEKDQEKRFKHPSTLSYHHQPTMLHPVANSANHSSHMLVKNTATPLNIGNFITTTQNTPLPDCLFFSNNTPLQYFFLSELILKNPAACLYITSDFLWENKLCVPLRSLKAIPPNVSRV